MHSANLWQGALTDDWQNGGFGLYIHWPFCEAKCPYCDFNSHVARQIDQEEWAAAYLSGLDRYGALFPDRVLHTVFFGGGTPSLMEPETVAKILQKVRDNWRLANDFEVTLEANPSSVEAGRFAAYAQAGVNRVSIGVQALNDPDLKRLGRIHSVNEARRAIEIANATFSRVSFDLIYARQKQTLEDWRAELQEGLTLSSGHLSLYQLTIEPNTAFGSLYKRHKLRDLPTDDLAADMYDLTQELCDKAGHPAYEISNHATAGNASRHNLIYWRYGDYIGIGPGAHGRITINGQRYATDTVLSPTLWLENVTKDQSDTKVNLSKEDQATEYLMMGLRITEGIDLDRYQSLSGHRIPRESLEFLQEQQLVTLNGDRLATTIAGRRVLNALISHLLGEVA